MKNEITINRKSNGKFQVQVTEETLSDNSLVYNVYLLDSEENILSSNYDSLSLEEAKNQANRISKLLSSKNSKPTIWESMLQASKISSILKGS